jgi:hypothetical protein
MHVVFMEEKMTSLDHLLSNTCKTMPYFKLSFCNSQTSQFLDAISLTSLYLFSHVQKPEAEELERRAKENDAFAAEVAEVTLFSVFV